MKIASQSMHKPMIKPVIKSMCKPMNAPNVQANAKANVHSLLKKLYCTRSIAKVISANAKKQAYANVQSNLDKSKEHLLIPMHKLLNNALTCN